MVLEINHIFVMMDGFVLYTTEIINEHFNLQYGIDILTKAHSLTIVVRLQ